MVEADTTVSFLSHPGLALRKAANVCFVLAKAATLGMVNHFFQAVSLSFLYPVVIVEDLTFFMASVP